MTTLSTPIKPARKGSYSLSFAAYQNLKKDIEEIQKRAYAELSEIIKKEAPEAYELFSNVVFLGFFEHTSHCRPLLPKEIQTARWLLRRVKRQLPAIDAPEESSHDQPSKLA